MKKLVLWMLMLLVLLTGSAMGEGEFPSLNEQGFYDDGEFVYENADEGVWRYAGPTLRVEIYRRTQSQPKQIWYEAEVWSAEGELFSMIPNNAEKRMTSLEWPYIIARKNQTVLAINSDYAHLRIEQKKRVGIILRAGEVLSEKTLEMNKGSFPNLDTLALLPDGDMQVFWSDEKTPQEYLDMGATDVLAFGPWLIRDGELNAEGLAKYGTSKAPRTAVGMVEPGHYFAMMLEGRHTQSVGAGVSFLAEKLKDKGCQVGFNLDGGQTSTMVFMGRQICKIGQTSGDKVSARKTAEILGIGVSELVADVDDEW
ncbi:MAG: phosphodiester glycosidase family protein [Eubacteriales bacterium]|nr:phosphodiester glycosidase family protein [Eubacteriales bacterium]